MHKGITPTFTLTLPEDIDLSNASHVYVTFSDKKGRKKVTMTEEALDIDGNIIRTTLRQEDTLKMSQMYIQVNWTYIEGGVTKRAASDVASVYFKDNLEGGVLA